MEIIQSRKEEIVPINELRINKHRVILIPGVITFGQDPNPCPNNNFQYSFLPNANRNDGHLPAVQIEVRNGKENSGPIVFFVIPQNDDTIIIGIPDDKGGLYPPLFVDRQPSMKEGKNNGGWNNFSYSPAAIACFQSQKKCTNFEGFLLYINQNPNPNSVLLDFPPDSDMAKILSLCHKIYFPQN